MKRLNKGWSLLELMLALAVIVAGSVFVYQIFKPSQTQAAVRQEQQNVGRLVDGIMGAYTTAANFSTLSSATAAGILNLPMNGSTLDSALHKNLTVQPSTSVSTNDSFDLVYAQLSSQQCQALIPALSSRSQGIFVGSNSNLQNARGEIANEGLVAIQCAASPSTNVTFRFRADKNTFAATATDSCLCAPETETQTLACATGSSGSITQRRTGTCTGGTPTCPSIVWSSWVTASNTCGVDSTPIAPIIPIAPDNTCAAKTEYQTLSCPTGQTGGIIQYRTQSCATNTFGPWANLSNSCQPIVNVGNCRPHTKPNTFDCPAGQGGEIRVERAVTCDAQGNEVAVNENDQSIWKVINSNCTASCVSSGTCCTVSRKPSVPSFTPCAIGSFGPGTTIVRQQSSSCPDPMGAPVWSDSGWRELSNTSQCNACPANSTTQASRWVDRVASCPSGQTGELVYSDEQVQDISTTYLCNSQAGVLNGNGTTTAGAWRNTGNTRTAKNTCATPPANECAVDGNYTITSQKLVITSGTTSRTVDPYTFGQLEYNSGSTNNMQVRGTVTGVFNGQPFTGTVGASQTPTLRGTGECYAHRGQGPNAYLNSCGGGGMPPGLDLYIFMANNSQAQMSLASRPCGSGSIARIPSGNLISYGTYSFIQTNQATVGQKTLVSLAKIDPPTTNGPLNAEYVNYTISYNDVTLSGLRGSCGPVTSNQANTEQCSSEQTWSFGGKNLTISIEANSSVLPTGKVAYARVFVTPQK